MYKIPLTDIKQKIIESGKLNSQELDEKIKIKINELSGLISEEGAAHIIANELGVELVKQSSEKLKIKEIYAGMRNVSTVGKVVRKFDVREFQKGESTGKVCSLILGDETGTTRVVFWNDQVDKIVNLKDEDILAINDAYVKENNNQKEIHISDRTEITINPPGETVGEVRQSHSFDRKKISELQAGQDNVELMGTVVQVFDPRFFKVCPNCNKRAVEAEGGHHCTEHGSVVPNTAYVLNAVLDDGSGTIRGVFWKNQTNHLLGKENLDEYQDNLAAFEEVKTDLLGEQFKVMGRVKHNDMFDRMELNVQMVEKANPKEELERLEKEES